MAEPDRTDRIIDTLRAGLAVDTHELISDADRAVLLRLALGKPEMRTERRFRNVLTGETAEQLDLRVHDFADWVSEQRAVITTAWEVR